MHLLPHHGKGNVSESCGNENAGKGFYLHKGRYGPGDGRVRHVQGRGLPDNWFLVENGDIVGHRSGYIPADVFMKILESVAGSNPVSRLR